MVWFKAGEMVYVRGQKAASVYMVMKWQVALRMPGQEGLSVPVDMCCERELFGTSIFFNMEHYTLNAHNVQCTEDYEVLKIDFGTLKDIMDHYPLTGMAIQSQIAKVSCNRYINTMQKLQTIVMNLHLETA